MNKADVRARARRLREGLPAAFRAEASRRAARALIGAPPFVSASRVALFAAFGAEADPAPVEDAAAANGAEVFYPRMNGERLHFLRARRGDLAPGRYGILEPPEGADEVPLSSIDLALVPGLAFDARGGRVGAGKAFYDRVLAEARGERTGKPYVVGFGFSCQVLPEVPMEAHDQRLDALVTEIGFVAFTRPPRSTGTAPV